MCSRLLGGVGERALGGGLAARTFTGDGERRRAARDGEVLRSSLPTGELRRFSAERLAAARFGVGDREVLLPESLLPEEEDEEPLDELLLEALLRRLAALSSVFFVAGGDLLRSADRRRSTMLS